MTRTDQHAWALAWVGLGANLPSQAGNPAETLARAVEAINARPDISVSAASSRYRSSPVDSEGPLYCNQVIRLRTRLSAEALLHELQAIEAVFGRERPYRNAPRTLDLDLLLYGGGQRPGDEGQHGAERRQGSFLTLPHPRMQERLFVLMPLAEIDPAIEIPGQGRADALLAALKSSCTDQVCKVLTDD